MPSRSRPLGLGVLVLASWALCAACTAAPDGVASSSAAQTELPKQPLAFRTALRFDAKATSGYFVDEGKKIAATTCAFDYISQNQDGPLGAKSIYSVITFVTAGGPVVRGTPQAKYGAGDGVDLRAVDESGARLKLGALDGFPGVGSKELPSPSRYKKPKSSFLPSVDWSYEDGTLKSVIEASGADGTRVTTVTVKVSADLTTITSATLETTQTSATGKAEVIAELRCQDFGAPYIPTN